MFAVIKTGGKQYKVAENDVITVETLKGDPGSMIALNDVLMMGGEGQKPTAENAQLEKAAVYAEVVEQTRGDKIIVFKKKRRHNYRRKKGHRQDQTVLRILGISPTGEKPKVKAKAQKPKAKPAAKQEDAKPAVTEETKTKAAPKKKAAPKAPAKKAPAKKAPAKKTTAKKADAKKTGAKKAPAKKAAAKSKPKSKE